jgi:chloramphenicol 3-O phosphotransferase
MIKNIVILLLLSGLFFLLFDKFGLKIKKNNKPGKIIILNGPSCAGKTSIQKAFQSLMSQENKLWTRLGIDNLFDAPFPEITLENIDYWTSKNDLRWIETLKDLEGNTIVPLKIGTEGEKVFYGMNKAIKGYLEAGNNIILDYIAYEKKFIFDLLKTLDTFGITLVKVDISLEELEKREIKRNTSPRGHGRSIYFTVHDSVDYDLVIDSEKNSPHEIAIEIKNFIEKR